jgi:hypothetical protein
MQINMCVQQPTSYSRDYSVQPFDVEDKQTQASSLQRGSKCILAEALVCKAVKASRAAGYRVSQSQQPEAHEGNAKGNVHRAKQVATTDSRYWVHVALGRRGMQTSVKSCSHTIEACH